MSDHISKATAILDQEWAEAAEWYDTEVIKAGNGQWVFALQDLLNRDDELEAVKVATSAQLRTIFKLASIGLLEIGTRATAREEER